MLPLLLAPFRSVTLDRQGPPVRDHSFIEPVLFKAEYRKAGQDFAPSLFAGPAVAFRTSCKLNAEAGSASVSDDCPADTISSTDWSLIFGLGLEYSRFVFQARYDLGLANVSQGGGDIKNGGWGITLGYGFPIK